MYCNGSVHIESRRIELKWTQVPDEFWTHVFQCECSRRPNWTELTCNKLTQLHDALLVTRVSVTKLSSWLQFSSVQFSLVQFVCCKHGFTCRQNMLSASEVTTLRCYTNLFIIIVIINSPNVFWYWKLRNLIWERCLLTDNLFNANTTLRGINLCSLFYICACCVDGCDITEGKAVLTNGMLNS